MIESARAIIDSAFKLVGILGDGTELTAQEYSDALLALNRMIDRWNLTDLLVYSVTRNEFPFVMGKSLYTLGPDGDFDIPRPTKIERVSITYGGVAPDPTNPAIIPDGVNPGRIELPIDADTDLETWQSIIVKGIPSAFPLVMYNDTDFPFMRLNFWPVPAQPCSVVLWVWATIDAASSLEDLLNLPQGYSDALVYNLAVRLCQMFDKAPSQALIAEAKQSKHDINGINNGTPSMHTDPIWTGRGGNAALTYQSAGWYA